MAKLCNTMDRYWLMSQVDKVHCKNIRISTDILWRVACGPWLHSSVDLRIQTYTEPVPLKYEKLATKYPQIYGCFFTVYNTVTTATECDSFYSRSCSLVVVVMSCETTLSALGFKERSIRWPRRTALTVEKRWERQIDGRTGSRPSLYT